MSHLSCCALYACFNLQRYLEVVLTDQQLIVLAEQLARFHRNIAGARAEKQLALARVSSSGSRGSLHLNDLRPQFGSNLADPLARVTLLEVPCTAGTPPCRSVCGCMGGWHMLHCISIYCPGVRLLELTRPRVTPRPLSRPTACQIRLAHPMLTVAELVRPVGLAGVSGCQLQK